MMFGYACRETDNFMPLALELSHRLLRELAAIRKAGVEMTYLRPDSKSQVTIEHADDGTPIRIEAIVLSTQHDDFGPTDSEMLGTIQRDVANILIPRVKATMSDRVQALFKGDHKLHVNPTGKFVIGGPHGDTGLTGRKIIVDTYGGRGAHGGGAFSGKDPSKVDRSAAYAARHVAKNLVAAGLARRAEVQLAYAIGVAEPVSVRVETFGTSDHDEGELSRLVYKHFDLTPRGIIDSLDLLRPIYRATSYHGHFGREDAGFPWEKTDRAEALRRDASK